jgi:hypothetical protein
MVIVPLGCCSNLTSEPESSLCSFVHFFGSETIKVEPPVFCNFLLLHTLRVQMMKLMQQLIHQPPLQSLLENSFFLNQ